MAGRCLLTSLIQPAHQAIRKSGSCPATSLRESSILVLVKTEPCRSLAANLPKDRPRRKNDVATVLINWKSICELPFANDVLFVDRGSRTRWHTSRLVKARPQQTSLNSVRSTRRILPCSFGGVTSPHLVCFSIFSQTLVLSGCSMHTFGRPRSLFPEPVKNHANTCGMKCVAGAAMKVLSGNYWGAPVRVA